MSHRQHQTTTLENMAEQGTETHVTVLVVEDDGEMRVLLREALERAGYRVIGRKDGAALSALVETERFNVAILDKELPGPNGLDLLSFLRQRLPEVPVILVTAFGGPDVQHEAARRGASGYVEKPFRVATLLDMLSTVLMPLRGGEPGLSRVTAQDAAQDASSGTSEPGRLLLERPSLRRHRPNLGCLLVEALTELLVDLSEARPQRLVHERANAAAVQWPERRGPREDFSIVAIDRQGDRKHLPALA